MSRKKKQRTRKTHAAGLDGKARCGRVASQFVRLEVATCGSCQLVESLSEARGERQEQLRIELEELSTDLKERQRRLARDLERLSHGEIVRREESIRGAANRIRDARAEYWRRAR